MKILDNSILEIATAETGLMTITTVKLIDDYDVEEIGDVYTVSETESYTGEEWSIKKISNIEECLTYIESSPKKMDTQNRNSICWWLKCRPLYIDNTIKHIIRNKILFYHSIGEIDKILLATDNPNYDRIIENLKSWIMETSIDIKIFNFPNKKSNTISNINYIEIQIRFIGFNTNVISNITINIDSNSKFQTLLDEIYYLIHKNVPAYSYGKNWILINTKTGLIINKANEDNISLKDIFDLNNTLICKSI